MATGARHHYVPQFHLRAWGHGDGRGRIWTYDKATDTITKRSVKGVAFEPDYYRVRSRTGGTHDQLEGLFSQIESAAAPWIKHLAALPQGLHEISPSARDAVAGYMAVLHARVPAQRDIVRGMGQLLEAAQIDMDLRNPDRFRKRARRAGTRDSDEEVERIRTETLADLESKRLVLEAPAEWGLTGLGPAVNQIRPLLASARWFVIRRQRFPWLVLSDQPVAIGRPEGYPSVLGVGFATPGAEISMPLSPDAILGIVVEQHDGSIAVLEPDGVGPKPGLRADWAMAANIEGLLNASRHVFGRSPADLEAARLALSKEERTRTPKMQVSGLPEEWERYLPPEVEIVDHRGRRRGPRTGQTSE